MNFPFVPHLKKNLISDMIRDVVYMIRDVVYDKYDKGRCLQ